MLHTQLLSVIIFLGSSVVLVSIFQRLGLGSILGYLAAGVLIGPQVTGLITDIDYARGLAEFGVVFLLFLIGLELQPKKLWSMRRSLLGFGGLQILLTTLIFSLVAHLFDLSWAASLVVGFSLSLSSTAFALQSLSEKKVLHTGYGRSAFSILLMQDVAAIPALAVIPSLGLGLSTAPTVNWWYFIFIFGAFAIISRAFMGPFLRQVASLRSRELFTGVTLLIVMGVSYLMESVGLSMALGAFLAGVFLSDSEYRHELEADLGPFKGLLMGLFFISVGMVVNLSLIQDRPFFMLGLTLMYMLLKGSVLFGVGRMMGLPRDSSRNLSTYLVQGGEFAFVIYGVGQSAQLLSPEWTQTLTLIIALSMILNPLIIVLQEKLERLSVQNQKPKASDVFEAKQNQIVIAGFGRFGQIFGRLLRSQDIDFTAIDHDTEQIELLRQFNFKVYYGDATRKEILEAAGLASAKFLVIALDDMAMATQIAQTVRKEYPHIKVFARARNRQHVFEMMELGVEHIRRETFDASLILTRELLVELGIPVARAHQMIDHFQYHDEQMLKEQFKVRHDPQLYVDVSRLGMQQLAQVLRDDQKQAETH